MGLGNFVAQRNTLFIHLKKKEISEPVPLIGKERRVGWFDLKECYAHVVLYLV